MKLKIIAVLSVAHTLCFGQMSTDFVVKGNFSREDSIHIVQSYEQARQGVDHMYKALLSIWNVSPQSGQSKKELRAERWRSDETFMKWLGEPTHMKLVARNIRKIHHKFDKTFILEVVKEDEGRCNRYVGAWAVPYGPVKVRLCRNYLNFRSDMSAKVLIHEVGHEAGMLSHRDLYNCRDVLQAATTNADEAKRSPETFAWLAMSYLGMDCNSRRWY